MMKGIVEHLQMEGVSSDLLREVADFSTEHHVDEKIVKRIPEPRFFY